MENILFYNASNGACGIAMVTGGELTTRRSYELGAFSPNWTHICDVPLTEGNILFYNKVGQSGAVGQPLSQGFKQNKTYPEHSFADWTHIVSIPAKGRGKVLFYNTNTGAGALGFDPTERVYPPNSMAPGWTHIIVGRSSRRTLFYNSATGAGALDFDPSTQVFAAGSFAKGWTNVASLPLANGQDALLYYNSNLRSGAIGILDASGHKTVRTYNSMEFGAWSHVVGLDDSFLFVNSEQGSAAIAKLDGDKLITTKIYKPGDLSRGWTHIVPYTTDKDLLVGKGTQYPNVVPLFIYLLDRYVSNVADKTELDRAIATALDSDPEARAILQPLVERWRTLPIEKRRELFHPDFSDLRIDTPVAPEVMERELRVSLSQSLVEITPGMRIPASARIPANLKEVSPLVVPNQLKNNPATSLKFMSGDAEPADTSERTFRIEFAGIYCEETTSGWGSDEPYVIFTTVQYDHNPVTTRSEIYENVDDGIDSGDDWGPLPPLLSLYGPGPAAEIGITALVMEHDEGDPDVYKKQVQALVKAAQGLAADYGIPIPDAVANIAGDIINGILGTGDDTVGVGTVVLKPEDFAAYVTTPLVHFKYQIDYHFATYHSDGHAGYYVYYRVVQVSGPKLPLTIYTLVPADSAAVGGAIATVSRKPETMEQWWIGSDGSIQGAFWYEGMTDWGRYTLVPAGSAALSGGIAAVSRKPETMEQWWIGSDGSVKGAFWYEGMTDWGHYTLVPAGSAATGGAITAVSRKPETMEQWWIGLDGSIKGAFWYEGMTDWGRYTLVPAGSAALSGGITAVSRKPETMEQWWIGSDGSIQGAFWNEGMTDWGHYTLVPAGSAALEGGIEAVSRKPETMELWWVGPDGSVRGAFWYEGMTDWGRYTLAPAGSAALSGGITAVSRKPETMELWWIGSDGSIKGAFWYEGMKAWTQYTRIGPGSAATGGAIAAVSRKPETTEQWWISSDGSIKGAFWYE